MATVQGGWAAKNGRTWLRRSLLRNTTAPEVSAPWTWKTLFARSKPIVLTCPMDASLEWCSTPPLWHTKAVGGRPPHQAPLFERLISEADVQIALRFRGLCDKLFLWCVFLCAFLYLRFSV